MKLVEFSDTLQTLCHKGFATCDVGVLVGDKVYQLEDLHKTTSFSKDSKKIIFHLDVKKNG